jgi:drebrin-like protein
VQITARSDTDLEPANILQKVADASGAKYTAGGSAPVKSAGAPPPVKSKPVFPTNSSSTMSFNPIVAARNASLRQKTDDDGWGDDAPQVSRTQIEKVESAYKPTKVDINALRSQAQPPSRFSASQQDDRPDVVRGAYQPVGKVDIAAIRAAAKEKNDDRPTVVKGAYEPVGKVDIAAIRAKAQKPAEFTSEEVPEQPKSLSERSAAFNQSERITELPKPKVTKKFDSPSSYQGTKPLNPGGFGLLGPAGGAPSNPQLGSAGRSFAAASGKSPAQLWAEKKAAQGGSTTPSVTSPSVTSPVTAQKSGGWQSGYTGKSWGSVQTGAYGRGIAGQKTGETVTSQGNTESEAKPESVSSLKDRFKDAAPIGIAAGAGAAAGAGIAAAAAHEDDEEEYSAPPPPPPATRPSDAPSGGFALPGMPPRPPPVTDEEEDEEEPEPIQVAVPVPRGPEPTIEPAAEPPRSLPTRPLAEEVPKEEELPEEEETFDPRATATAVAEQQFGQEAVAEAPGASGGRRALIQYDYEKAEDNEVELREGEYVTNIEMVDEDWWMGTNSAGESGLFPSNYVELVDDDDSAGAAVPPPPPPAAAEPEPEPEPEAAAGGGATATASFDYEAAEDNGTDCYFFCRKCMLTCAVELSFPEGAKITNLEFPDDDWWFGHYNGASGLFPANYVELDQ